MDLPEDVFGFAMLRVEKRGGLCVAVGGDPARLAYGVRFSEEKTVRKDEMMEERSRHAGAGVDIAIVDIGIEDEVERGELFELIGF